MTKEEVLKLLKQYQEWRRYKGPIGEGPEMPDPKEIGIALDWAIKYLEE